MSVFFAGTFYWIALTNPKDSAHGRVMKFTGGLGPRAVVTTDEVLTELLAYSEAILVVDRPAFSTAIVLSCAGSGRHRVKAGRN